MAFQPINIKTPTAVQKIVIKLVSELFPDGGGGTTDERGIAYEVTVVDQDGNGMPFPHSSGNLQPHLSGAQLTQLNQFMTDMRTKAEAEFLP